MGQDRSSGGRHLPKRGRAQAARTQVSRRIRLLFSSKSHVAAICYRIREGEIEFLLVRTHAGRWTFPKGAIDGDRTPAAAAAREAYEEAGVRGRVEAEAFDRYLHTKNGFFFGHELPVAAHLCRVFVEGRPLEAHRDPTWFTPSKAKQRVRKLRKRKYAAEMSRVIDRALRRITVGRRGK